MKLFIPVVGTEIELLKNTKVNIKKASQNNKFVESLESMTGTAMLPGKDTHLTLPKGLRLTVDRVYIRQGDSADFNSLTFKTDGLKNKIPKGRFFIPVSNANMLDVKVIEAEKTIIPLKNTINQKWRSYDYNNRRSNFDILKTIIADTPHQMTGSISIDMTFEMEQHIAYFESKLNEKGYSSIDEAKTELLKRFSEDEFELIKERISNARRTVIGKNKVHAIDFKVYVIDNQLVLYMDNNFFNHENTDLITSFDLLRNAIECSIMAINHNDARSRYFDFKDFGYNLIWCESTKEKFGLTSWTNGPFYQNQDTVHEAYLLEPIFSSSKLLHTKEANNYRFTYEIDGLGEVAISKFRRTIKALLKK